MKLPYKDGFTFRSGFSLTKLSGLLADANYRRFWSPVGNQSSLLRESPTQFPLVRLSSTSSFVFDPTSPAVRTVPSTPTPNTHLRSMRILLYSTPSFGSRWSVFLGLREVLWRYAPLLSESYGVRPSRQIQRTSIGVTLYIHFTLRLLISLTFLRLLRKRTACGVSKTLKIHANCCLPLSLSNHPVAIFQNTMTVSPCRFTVNLSLSGCIAIHLTSAKQNEKFAFFSFFCFCFDRCLFSSGGS